MSKDQCLLKNNSILPCEEVFKIMGFLTSLHQKNLYSSPKIATNMLSLQELNKLARDPNYKIFNAELKNNLKELQLLRKDNTIEEPIKNVIASITFDTIGGEDVIKYPVAAIIPEVELIGE